MDSRGSESKAFKAPRILKEPPTWRLSSFRTTSQANGWRAVRPRLSSGVRRTYGEMRLAAARPNVVRVIEITGLNKVFASHASVEDATTRP